MPEDLGERTEQPTARRLEHARQRGQVAFSRDFNGAVVLLAATIAFHMFGGDMLADAGKIMRYCLATAWLDLDLDRLRVETTRLLLLTGWAVFPWIVLVLTAAVGVSVFQTGGLLVATDRQYVDFARLNPAAGIRRIFSLRGLVRTALDSGKVALVGLVAYLFLVSEMPALAAMAGLGFPEMVAYALQRSVLLAYEMTAVILALAFADYLYQRFQYFRDLRMTREEVRQELKDIEGDPQIRIRRRQIQLRIARQRMMERVPEAEVVITNPTELAVALQYDPQDMDAPEVVAKGAGFVAQRIREIARQHHIPIVENPPLAQLLFRKTDVGRSIPEESFVAVAELMAYVYRISGRKLSHLA